MVRVISFDVVGTLVDSYYEDYVWRNVIPQLYAERKGISLTEAKTHVFREYDYVSRNDIRWYLPAYWFRHFRLGKNPVEVFRVHSDKVHFYPEVPSVLKDLSQKYDLIIVSGTTREIVEIMIEKISDYFIHIYSPVSDRHEVKKTPQLYEGICKALEIKPCDMIHVGDEWHADFIFPRSIGIRSVFLDRTGEKTGSLIIRDLTELEEKLQFL